MTATPFPPRVPGFRACCPRCSFSLCACASLGTCPPPCAPAVLLRARLPFLPRPVSAVSVPVRVPLPLLVSDHVVGRPGLEPGTCGLKVRRAASCASGPGAWRTTWPNPLPLPDTPRSFSLPDNTRAPEARSLEIGEVGCGRILVRWQGCSIGRQRTAARCAPMNVSRLSRLECACSPRRCAVWSTPSMGRSSGSAPSMMRERRVEVHDRNHLFGHSGWDRAAPAHDADRAARGRVLSCPLHGRIDIGEHVIAWPTSGTRASSHSSLDSGE